MIVKEVLIRLKYWELFNRDLKPQIRCDKWNEIVEADNAMLHLNSRRLIFKNYRLDRLESDKGTLFEVYKLFSVCGSSFRV